MDAVTYSEARNNLASVLDRVSDDREPIIITRKTGRNAVLIALEDYNAWLETEHLLKSPANAQRLLQSLENARSGENLQEHKLTDA